MTGPGMIHIVDDEEAIREALQFLLASRGLAARVWDSGEAFLTAGTTALLRWPGGRTERKMRVVYVTDEARRAGFALGTADEAGVIGETAYVVEHREDDTVWAVARGFYWAPASGLFGLKARAAIRLAVRDTVHQLAALAPGAASEQKTS